MESDGQQQYNKSIAVEEEKSKFKNKKKRAATPHDAPYFAADSKYSIKLDSS